MSNVQKFDAGGFGVWRDLSFEHPQFGKVFGKHFVGERLGLTALEASLNSMAPGVGMPFSHAHRHNEELYLFLSGRGEMRVDDQTFDLAPGTVVGVQPGGARTWRNTGDEPLIFVVVQARPSGEPVRGFSDGVKL